MAHNKTYNDSAGECATPYVCSVTFTHMTMCGANDNTRFSSYAELWHLFDGRPHK